MENAPGRLKPVLFTIRYIVGSIFCSFFRFFGQVLERSKKVVGAFCQGISGREKPSALFPGEGMS